MASADDIRPSGHHHHHGHDHHHDDGRPAVSRLSVFTLSALERMGMAVILVGLVWIAILWAVR